MIKITKLNKYFYHKQPNEIHVINDVSLEFPNTGLVSIVGESGSGKTTLMNVIGGLDNFHSGLIEIDDFQIDKYNSKKIDRIRNEKIGYIFQNFLLLSNKSVYENLELVLNMYDLSNSEKNERIEYVLKAVGMFKYKKKLVSELSGGQQQRVAIARALIKSPSLILADEPTGNLDEKNTIQIMNIIKKISKTTLVILVSHEERIARSYSDYMIEVCDGKITSQKQLINNSQYEYEDNHNIYLKEYSYQKLANEEVNIDFYSNDQAKISLQIVYHKGKFHIKSDQDIVYVDKNSDIEFLYKEREVLDTETEINDISYELTPLKYTKTPSLSFKEKIKLTSTNLKKMKKRTLFLAFPLILIVVLCMFSIHNMISVSKVNKTSIVFSDSRIYNLNTEKKDLTVNRDMLLFGFKHMYQDFTNKNPNIEFILDNQTTFKFKLPKYAQLESKTYDLSGFSFLTTDVLDEQSIIYGRMPETIFEIVVEKTVLERAIKNSTLGNFMDVRSFIGKEINAGNSINVKDKPVSYTIVGITDNLENTIYVNKWMLFDLYPSTIRKNGTNIISLSEIQKISDKYNEYTLNDNEVLVNKKYGISNINDTTLNNDPTLKFNIKKIIEDNDSLYDVILPDSAYEKIKLSVLAENYSETFLYCENENEVKQVEEYFNNVKEYYLSGDLKATKENGFTGISDNTDVKISFTFFSRYNEILNPHLEEARKAVNSRIIITLTILLVSGIIIFFSMKSYAIKNIYDIGVYRALGIKKGSIVFVYALEVLAISFKTTFIGGTLYYLVNNILSTIPIIQGVTSISFGLYAIVTGGLIVLNVIIGIIPVSLYLRLTPSQILTKHDI